MPAAIEARIEPDVTVFAAALARKLDAAIAKRIAAIEKQKPVGDIEVVFEKGPQRAKRRRRQRRFGPNDLVKISTMKDGEVCKACAEMAAHSPYRYADAKKQLPHHPFCRCTILPLTASDPGFLVQTGFKKAQRYIKKFRRVARSVKSISQGKVSQRLATVKRLRKKGRRFVAPTGVRSVRSYRRRGL